MGLLSQPANNKDKMKNMAISGSAIALAVMMGLQTYVFGENDIEKLKEEVASLSERLAKMEQGQDVRSASLHD